MVELDGDGRIKYIQYVPFDEDCFMNRKIRCEYRKPIQAIRSMRKAFQNLGCGFTAQQFVDHQNSLDNKIV